MATSAILNITKLACTSTQYLFLVVVKWCCQTR